MKIYIMRHAQASFNALSDRERPITDLGVEQTRKMFLSNKDEFSEAKLLWCSDLLRARQTAGIASEIINIAVVEKPLLSPDGDVRQVLKELQKLEPDTCLLIVSHQPLVGELVSCLVNGNIHQSHPYATSEVLALELDIAQPGMATQIKQYLPA